MTRKTSGAAESVRKQVNNDKKYLANDIIIAGNLTYERCPYIYNLDRIASKDVQFKLYGFGYKEKNIINPYIQYCGNYSADEIPYKIDGKWGLVWDGESIETCSGPTGEYVVYINQHRVSLYLAAGLPVIIFSTAGLADFIKNNDLGVCVSSLEEIKHVLNKISEEEYNIKKRNASLFAKELMSGSYANSAIKKMEKIMNCC